MSTPEWKTELQVQKKKEPMDLEKLESVTTNYIFINAYNIIVKKHEKLSENNNVATLNALGNVGK